MYIHNLNPIIFDFGILSLRWYSLAYLIGIIFGWWYGKKILLLIKKKVEAKFDLSLFVNSSIPNDKYGEEIKLF